MLASTDDGSPAGVGSHRGQISSVQAPGTMHTTTGGGRASDTLAPRRVEDETTRGGVFRALHEIGVAIGGILDPPELAHLVADHARELLHAGGAGLYVSDDSSQHLKPLHSSDADATAPEPSIPLGEGAAWPAAPSPSGID